MDLDRQTLKMYYKQFNLVSSDKSVQLKLKLDVGVTDERLARTIANLYR